MIHFIVLLFLDLTTDINVYVKNIYCVLALFDLHGFQLMQEPSE
jgi:hypothetical protein